MEIWLLSNVPGLVYDLPLIFGLILYLLNNLSMVAGEIPITFVLFSLEIDDLPALISSSTARVKDGFILLETEN